MENKVKYEITPYIKDVIKKIQDGWKLKYNTSNLAYPETYLVRDNEVESISNWTMTVLWGNGMLKADGKNPITSYKLIKSIT